MNAPSKIFAASADVRVWPVPPTWQAVSATSDPIAWGCTIENMEGHILKATLLRFDPAEGHVTVATDEHETLRSISLEQVRAIWLIAPVSLPGDSEPKKYSSADAPPGPEPCEFHVRFPDGRTFNGTTYGFVKNSAGLFFYLPDAPGKAARFFIPAQQAAAVDFGAAATARAIHDSRRSPVASAWSDSLAARHQRELDSLVLNIGIVSAAELTSSLQFRSNRPQIRLGEFLVAARLITPEQLSVARATQVTHPASRLGEILVEQGIITEHTVLMAAAYKLNIPFVNIRNFPIDPAALKLVKSKFASDHLVLPLMCLEHSLVVAVGNPLAKDSTHGLPFLTGRTVVPVFANTDDLRTRIASEYGELDTAITIGVPDGLRAARKAAAPRASWHKLVE